MNSAALDLRLQWCCFMTDDMVQRVAMGVPVDKVDRA